MIVRPEKIAVFVKAGLDSESPWNDLKGSVCSETTTFLEKHPLLKDKSTFEIPRVQAFADSSCLGG